MIFQDENVTETDTHQYKEIVKLLLFVCPSNFNTATPLNTYFRDDKKKLKDGIKFS